MISRRVAGAFYRVHTLEWGMGDLYFNTARHVLLKAYVGARKLGLACALYMPMPQVEWPHYAVFQTEIINK